MALDYFGQKRCERPDTYYSEECPPKVGDTIFYRRPLDEGACLLEGRVLSVCKDVVNVSCPDSGYTKFFKWNGLRFIRKGIHVVDD